MELKKLTQPQPVYTETFTAANGTTTSTEWSISGDNDWTAWEVTNNEFYGRNVDQEAVWTSKCIDISTCSNVIVTLDAAATSTVDPTDRFQVFYNVDGAGEVLLLDLDDENSLDTYPRLLHFQEIFRMEIV